MGSNNVAQRRTDIRRITVTDVNLQTSLGSRILLGRDPYGGQLEIDLTQVPPGMTRWPLIGETWWVERRGGRWVLWSTDSSQVESLNPVPLPNWTPTLTASTGSVIVHINPGFHKFYRVVEDVCFFTYSVFVTTSGVPRLELTLPLSPQRPRQVFTCDLANRVGRATTQDSYEKAFVSPWDGTNVPNMSSQPLLVSGHYQIEL